jgi:hypothetical protein
MYVGNEHHQGHRIHAEGTGLPEATK